MSYSIIIIIICFIILFYILFIYTKQNEQIFNDKLILLNEMINVSKKNIEEKLLSQDNKYKEYIDNKLNTQELLLEKEKDNNNNNLIKPLLLNNIIIDRDRSVISDPLYPPLGRTERPIFDSLIANYGNNLFNYPTRGSVDTFRLLGYLVNSKNKRDSWKLFGRQKYPGSSIGDFYVIPINDNINEMKITLKDTMMPNEKIRDIYALPQSLTIISPLFESSIYTVIELDKADLTSPYF